MRRLVLLVLLVLSTAASADERGYTLFVNAMGEPKGGIPVKITVPKDWTQELDKMGSPSFTPPGYSGFLNPSVVAIFCGDAKTPDACVDFAVKVNFGDDKVDRQDLGPGRRWVQFDGDVKGHRQFHGRLFQYDAKTGAVIMCLGLFTGDDLKLIPDLKNACSTLKVRP